MAQFTFKCPQCGTDIEADDSLCGQVAECPSCGKGIVIPRNITNKPSPSVRLRPVSRDLPPASQPASATSMPNRITEFERMAEKEAERRRQERRHESMMMVLKVAVALVLIGGGGIFGFMKWNETKRIEAEQLRAQREAAQKAEREEAERQCRIAKEEKEKKDAMVSAFHAYLDREEARLKNIIEESKIACEAIDIDRNELSEELERIEKENARRAELSQKRGTERYDKAEHVLLIMKSQELSRMFDKYCGEDLTAIRTKYENEVNAILKLYRESTARLRKNKEKYYASVKGINEEVNKKNERASSKISAASLEAEIALKDQQRRLVELKARENRLKKDFQGPKVRNEISEVRKQITELEEVIATTRSLVTANRAQAAHMDATTAESSARRKFDTALEVRQSDDNDVHSDVQHKSNIFQLAGRYEQVTLDKLRTAMRISSEFQVARAAEARKKLDYITRSTANLELMKADEIENLRKKVVAELAENVVDDGKKAKSDEH